MGEGSIEEHRIWSAVASFQKGLYHLFLLRNRLDSDVYSRILRTYQTLFFLVAAGFLMDTAREIPRPRHRELAPDPAGDLEHATLRRWPGFQPGHPLESISKTSVTMLRAVWQARSNLVYRPYIQLVHEGGTRAFFEDCTLQDLLPRVPTERQIEDAYSQFLEGMHQWNVDADERAVLFLTVFHSRYVDSRGAFPPSTLLRRYALILTERSDLHPDFENFEVEWMGRAFPRV